VNRPVRLTAVLDNLDSARAVVHITSGVSFASFGTADVRVELRGEPAIVRRLLSDALTQHDAAQA
jgi:hypothetical protein